MRARVIPLILLAIWAAPSRVAIGSEVPRTRAADTTYRIVQDPPDLRVLLDRHDSLNPFLSGPLPAAAAATPSLQYAGSTLWNSIMDVVVQGSYAYCITPEGLLILDVTDPAHPFRVSQCYMQGNLGRDLEVRGDYVYATDGTGGLVIADVSDPAFPAVIAAVASVRYIRDVEISGDYAYVSSWEVLHIFDISDPYHPVEVATDSPRIGGARSSVVSGDYLYVAAGTLGVHVVNVAYPFAPLIMYTYPQMAVSEVVAASGDYFHAQNNTSLVYTWDIINPATPEYLGGRATWTIAWDMVVSDGILYESGDRVLTIADIFHPPPLFATDIVWDSLSSGLGLTLDADYIYVADGQEGLKILKNYGATKMPTRVGTYETPDYIERVTLSEDYALVRDFTWMPEYSWALHIVDIRDPSIPVVAGTHHSRGKIYDAEGRGDYVYAADNLAGLQTLDISDPASPTVVNELTGVYAYDLALGNDYAYLAGLTGLQILDLSSPMKPTLLTTLEGLGRSSLVATSGNYVYLATDSLGFQVVDVTNPEGPVALGHYPMTGIADLAALGNHVYVATGSSLATMDVSNPRAPFLASQYYISARAMGVAAQGDYVYVAEGPYYSEHPGVRMFDITDPGKPTPVYTYYSAGFPWDVAVKGPNLLVADYFGFVSLTTHLGYGDVNADGSVSVADVRYLTNYLFEQGPAPSPTVLEGDADCSGVVDLVDVVYLVNYIFRGGPPPC